MCLPHSHAKDETLNETMAEQLDGAGGDCRIHNMLRLVT